MVNFNYNHLVSFGLFFVLCIFYCFLSAGGLDRAAGEEGQDEKVLTKPAEKVQNEPSGEEGQAQSEESNIKDTEVTQPAGREPQVTQEGSPEEESQEGPPEEESQEGPPEEESQEGPSEEESQEGPPEEKNQEEPPEEKNQAQPARKNVEENKISDTEITQPANQESQSVRPKRTSTYDIVYC